MSIEKEPNKPGQQKTCEHCGAPQFGLTSVKTLRNVVELMMKTYPPIGHWSDADLDRLEDEITPGAQLMNLFYFSARFQLVTGEIVEVVRHDPVYEPVDRDADNTPLCRPKDEGRQRIGR